MLFEILVENFSLLNTVQPNLFNFSDFMICINHFAISIMNELGPFAKYGSDLVALCSGKSS